MSGVVQVILFFVLLAVFVYISAAVVYLLRINKAACALMRYIRRNRGETADRPIQIVANSDEDAGEMAKLLNDLEQSLIDYDREERVR